jgi:serine/threonine-protein kinase
MRLTAGTRLGPYDIQSALGAGGMGEVYLARDTNLARDVAIKVLPEAFAHDSERLARFEREARTLAALNHPNIAIVHGLETVSVSGVGQVRALVMELVDGPTLADLIGGLAVDDALRIARQIADALEAAHEQGIVHRDLKPANVKVRPDGTVKVLDFGLAKAAEPVSAMSPSLSLSPTITSPAMTAAGLILGTAAYMSPEQAKGREADKRSDVWSFGAVLYEMLTGRRAFAGDDVSDTLASVLKSEPDWSIVPADVPPAVVSLLKGCLAKDRRERVSGVSTAKFVLKDLGTIGALSSPSARPTASSWRARVLPVAIAAAVTAVIVGTAAWMMRPTPGPPDVVRFAFTAEGPFTSVVQQMISVSPDGTKVAYSAGGRIRVRSVGELESRALTDPEIIPLNPVFAPDGDSIAFISVSENGPAVRRIPIAGGTPSTLATLKGIANFSSMSWGRDGILVGTTAGSGILRVSPQGGALERIVSVASDESVHHPQMLPDGRTLLFTLAKGTADDRWDKATIVAHSLADHTRRVLIDGGADARYVETGHLVYAVGGTMYAVPFDLRTLTVRGTPVPVIVGIRRAPGATNGAAQFAASATGTMAYVTGPATSLSTARGLAVSDGRGDPVPLKLPPGIYAHPRISPNGRMLAASRSESSASDIWTYDLSGSAAIQRLTFGGQSRLPVWSADSRRVTFQSARDRAIWWQAVDGGTAERLTSPLDGEEHIPEAWSPDGSRLLFSIRKSSRYALTVLTLKGLKAEPFGDVQSADPISASFSPDGRWVAYAWSQSGGGAVSPNRGVFVEPFPSSGVKRQAPKTLLDYHPRWSPDGKSIVYVPGAARALVSVPVSPGPPFVFGTTVDMPRGPIPGLLSIDFRGYDLLPDGRIVSVSSALGDALSSSSSSEIRVVLNWFEELKRLAPAK